MMRDRQLWPGAQAPQELSQFSITNRHVIKAAADPQVPRARRRGEGRAANSSWEAGSSCSEAEDLLLLAVLSRCWRGLPQRETGGNQASNSGPNTVYAECRGDTSSCTY
jgi:hypothetical protein